MVNLQFDLQPGRTLGQNYTIIGYLGGGWEGEVYKIEEKRTGIVRAAKLFYSRGGVGERALLRYAKKLYNLHNCPIVIKYHHRDTTYIRGRQIEFLVSDLIDGEMLSTFLKQQRGNRLSTFEALHLFYSLVVGVEQIHFLGEYHGDIHSDNIMVKRKGLGFDVHLLDFFDLGRPSRVKIQHDVLFLIDVLYEIIGGANGYRQTDNVVKSIICGRKHTLIKKKFRSAGDLRLALENLAWGT